MLSLHRFSYTIYQKYHNQADKRHKSCLMPESSAPESPSQSSLRYVVVMPASAGKTTLSTIPKSEDPFFLDVDELYSLTETQATYDRMNKQILELVSDGAELPEDIAHEHRSRVQAYQGSARCLLVHSLDVAKAGGLNLQGVWLPSFELHEKAMQGRSEMSRWIATKNRKSTLEDAEAAEIASIMVYDDWESLDRLVRDLKIKDRMLPDSTMQMDDSEQMGPPLTRQRTDEEYLINLVASGLGCKLATEPLTG